MLISNTHTRNCFRNINIKVEDKLMEESHAIRILGVTMTNNLTWDNHIKTLINNLKYCYIEASEDLVVSYLETPEKCSIMQLSRHG